MSEVGLLIHVSRSMCLHDFYNVGIWYYENSFFISRFSHHKPGKNLQTSSYPKIKIAKAEYSEV